MYVYIGPIRGTAFELTYASGIRIDVQMIEAVGRHDP
jgi:hypothetical protein